MNESINEVLIGTNELMKFTVGGHWKSSPRHVAHAHAHASPSSSSASFLRELRDRPRSDSKRNSSCFDDSETHWEAWRYEDAVSGQDDNYALVYYPAGRFYTLYLLTPTSELQPQLLFGGGKPKK